MFIWKNVPAIAWCLLLLVSCKQRGASSVESISSTPPPTLSGFLTPSDLKMPQSLSEVKREDIAREINENSNFLNPSFYVLNNPCFSAAFASFAVTADETVASLEAKSDLTKCFNESYEAESEATVVFKDVKVHVLYKVGSYDTDMRRFHRMNALRFLGTALNAVETGHLSSIFQVEISYDLDVFLNGVALTSFRSRTVSALNDDHAKSCDVVVANGKQTYLTCSRYEITRYGKSLALAAIPDDLESSVRGDGVDSDDSEHFFRAHFKSVTAAAGEEYLESGSMDFRLNNWVGTMSFATKESTWVTTRPIVLKGTYKYKPDTD